MTTVVNIASDLPARALAQPERLAVAQPLGRGYREWTYHQLNDESDVLARGLEGVGLQRGTRTVLMVAPSLEFFALTFALFKLGAVPVLVDPGMGLRNLGKCLAEAEPEAFIGIPKAHLARLLFGWAKRTVKVLVTVGRRWFWGGPSWQELRARGRAGLVERGPILEPTQADDTAAILFTSGSTGVPKGAVYTHGIFTAQVEMLRQLFDIQPDEIDLCTFPLFALFAPPLGLTAIIPEMDFTRPARVNPRKIAEPIQRWEVTNFFGSPALLGAVGKGCQNQTFLTLRRVVSAGAPVPAKVLQDWGELFPEQVFTPYGATEALPVACIGSTEILNETRHRTAQGAGVCVGRHAPGMEIAIIRIDDGPIPNWSDDLRLPQGVIGEIAVQGPVVTRAYFNRPDLTALAKITDARGGLWHRMGDIGYFDEQGRLWFCGRKSQRVRTEKGTLFPDQCEGVFNVHPAVFRTALVGVGEPGRQQPVLCVEQLPGRRGNHSQVKRELLELGQAQPLTRDITTFLFHPSFPVDVRHNSKIFREKLALWAERQLR